MLRARAMPTNSAREGGLLEHASNCEMGIVVAATDEASKAVDFFFLVPQLQWLGPFIYLFIYREPGTPGKEAH